ncbi:universal stress protein [Vicingus serpentipes]|uniref:Universal stress protein n=1 Tax=Vicingus serpentipes TaxID=1926625 RepID=A0A5C6RYX4_9FLAO|nr:universal stress protein [Vicingus serpentipes]TXB66999.1 universal stress protein [Vicingus serpentipes]
MVKNILVPTDFSKCSMYAVKLAAKIAREVNATLHFLHVIEVPVVAYDVGMVNFESLPQAMFMRELADKNMIQLFEEGFLEGLNVKTTIEYDAIYKRINQYVSKNDIGLIVMGSHGASGISELVIGSNAERVTRYAECPVLTIKKEHNNFDVKNIVLASNFYGETDIMFKEYEKLKGLFNAKLHLLKVITPANFEATSRSKNIINDFVQKHKIENCSVNIYNHENAEEGILEFSEEVKADMILIGTHGRTGLSHLINGSIAEDLLNHASRPVLSIKIDIPENEHDVLFPEA